MMSPKMLSICKSRLWQLSSLLLLLAWSFSVIAQSQSAVFETRLKEGFEQNKAGIITAFFSDRVQLELDNQSGTYSQQQAAALMDEFLKQQHVIKFNIIKSGKAARSEANFLIGELTTKETLYRVYVLSSEIADMVVVHSLSITKI